MSNQNLSFDEIIKRDQELQIQKSLALESAFKGNDVRKIMQAQSYLKSIEKREVVDSKSILVDPMELTTSFGYKDKAWTISYDVLRAMAKTNIIKAIIDTRKEQVSAFCEPQRDKYSTGFVIQKRQRYIDIGKQKEVSTVDKKKIEWLTEFILNCGTTQNFWHADTFDVFANKIIDDSLTFDQATFEIVRNRKGEPIEFFATDGSTYRMADTYNDDEETIKDKSKLVQGYGPSYVQIYQNQVVSEFYPWELCFGIRNSKTDIRLNGYGRCELEDMAQVVTAILNSDTYNANFFKVGSAPKGILKYTGNINQNTVEDFRRQWMNQVAGVMNMHKIPIINADKLDFINTHVSNKDMEFGKYYEFLIKIACAMFKIDPSEIGFPMGGNAQGSSGLGGDSTEEKLEYSRDKGLKPLLKRFQYWINKYLIWQLDPDFELRFVGIDASDEKSELDSDIERLSNFATVDEIRAKQNLPILGKEKGGDVILNPTYIQYLGMVQQQQQGQDGGEGDGSQFMQPGEDGQDEDQQDGEGGDNNEDNNPFMKSLAQDLEVILCS